MRKILVFVMVLSLSVMLLGCSGTDTSKEANDTTQNTKQEEKQDTSQEKTEPTQDKTEQKDEQAEENDSKAEDSGDHEAQDQILKLYYISDSEEIECAEIRTNLLQTTDIWNGLIGEGVLSSECNVDQEQKTIDLDVDSGTGSYIRSMGTTGEEQILTCIKKSFLKTYECERFKITENGQPLETGHTVLKGYMTADE